MFEFSIHIVCFLFCAVRAYCKVFKSLQRYNFFYIYTNKIADFYKKCIILCGYQINFVPLRADMCFNVKKGFNILFFLLPLLMGACRPSTMPKPYGYFRITIPDSVAQNYVPDGYPYAFRLSQSAEVLPRVHADEQYWIDIHYPSINVTVHCTYKPIRENLRELSRDAQEFLYNHATIASAIPGQDYANPEQKVYGVYYELHGNTASPIQFVLTDSIEHFFRGSVYYNDIPNQDSLYPIFEFMQYDVRRMMETMQWR